MIDLTPIFQAIIALLAALVTYKLIPWIKSRTTERQQQNLFVAAKIAVMAAEQLYKNGEGDKKLEYARDVLVAAGFDVNLEVLRAAIESAVYSLPANYLMLEDPVEKTEDPADEPEEHPPEPEE